MKKRIRVEAVSSAKLEAVQGGFIIEDDVVIMKDKEDSEESIIISDLVPGSTGHP